MRFEFDEEALQQKQQAGDYCLPADSAFVRRMGSELLSQLFSFYVEGAMKWYKADRLPKPPAVKSATQSLLAKNDAVQQFIDECCEVDESYCEASASVYEKYQAWLAKNETQAVRMTREGFRKEMENKGYKKKAKKIAGESVRVFKGIRCANA